MRLLIYIVALILLSSCANMVIPTGGKKDEKIPTLKSSNLRSTNFTDRVIKLQFDEYVILEDPLNNISIQPKHSTFKIEMISKTIYIKLDSALHDNTTYTFTIDKGIKDVHEGNSYSFNYTFSTSENLDTNYTEYIIQNFDKLNNIKIGLTKQNIDSISQLKFEYFYSFKSNIIRLNGLNNTPYKVWVFTDKNFDKIPDQYFPIYYDTFIPNSIKKIELNNWNNTSNLKTKRYNIFTKIYKPINDVKTYAFDDNSIIYLAKDSALFYQVNSDTLPHLDIRKEIINKINTSIIAIKSNKEYTVIIDKCGMKNISIIDPIKYTEDKNFITIQSKYKIDSLNLKFKINNDSFTFITNIKQYTASNTLSVLKINKTPNKDTIIMVIYKDDKEINSKKLILDKDQIFYMQPGNYHIEFFKTNSYQNLSFNFNELKRISTPIIKKEILLKPNWDEVLQLIF